MARRTAQAGPSQATPAQPVPARAVPPQALPPGIVFVPENQSTPMKNEEDAQYLLDFHHEYEQRLSKIILNAGKDLERLAVRATEDIDKLAWVIHESTLSGQPPRWDLLSDGDDDDRDNSRYTAAPAIQHTPPGVHDQPPISSTRDEPITPAGPLTKDEELQVLMAMINKVNGIAYTLADLETAKTMLNYANSPRVNPESSTNPSSEATSNSRASHSASRTDVESGACSPPEDIEAADVLLGLALKGKKTVARRRKLPEEYKDSDYPHHTLLGDHDPLGISDLSKTPGQVTEANAPPAKRTRTRR